MKKVLVQMADGFEEIEAIAVIDILRRAGVDTKLVSISDNKTVVGAHDIAVNADLTFSEADFEDCDMIFLPGGGPGTKNLKAHKGLAEKLLQFDSSRKWIAAICAAPTVLGVLGLLEGRRAVCYPGCEEELLGAKPGTSNVEVDGHVITSKGAGTALELGLKLAEILAGPEKANALKKGMLISF
ncbi:MAG: DJ-1/PfpI family protein [Clostridia bacterium]|nr:DJ-1/PfpI family protein [Clostridia bacterium]